MAGIVIEDALVEWIESQPEAVAAGAKVYPWAKAPQATAARPYVLYQRVSGGRVRSLSGPSGVSRPRIQLDFYGRDYAAVRDLAATIRTRLEALPFGTTMAGRTVQVGIVHDDFDQRDEADAAPRHGTEDAEHRFTLDLTIWFHEE